MNKELIGKNAGIVWRVLNDRKSTWEELVKSSGLKPLEIAAAIGWLAREDKINMSIQDGLMSFDVYHECYY
ncbi:MAG: winged helix-turn-helix domain-containing protein [Prevotella sp.]